MKYSDIGGRQYNINLNFRSAKQLKSSEGVDLLDPEQILNLLSNPMDAVDALYVLSEPVSGDMPDAGDFGAALDGEAAEKAIDALQQAIINFTPARNRATLEAAIQKTVNFTSQANQKLEETFSSDHLEQLFEQGLTERLEALKQIVAGKQSSL